MWKGDLAGKISTDTINAPTAYGLGPIEYLQGEILLFEGQTFVSKVVDSASHEVKQIHATKAPFFVYSKRSELINISIPNGKLSLTTLEQLIDSMYVGYDKPLLVRIDGIFENVSIHSVNLPEGSVVSSPKDAHQGLINYDFENVKGALVGFFSRYHQSIFTHHDSYFHAHFISDDRAIMGHIDAAFFDSETITFRVSK